MPLDRALKPLARFFDAQRVPMAGLSAAEVRASFELLGSSPVPDHLLAPVASVDDRMIGQLPARVYRPLVDGPTPTVLFMHGGGFVLGSVDGHDAQVRELCSQTGSTCLSLDYRLAPEAKYPAAVEDSLAAMEWVLANLDALGGDATRVAVAGDSAGANLAAVVAQAYRTQLSAALLIYPVVDFTLDSTYDSQVSHADDGIILTAELMEWFHGQYVPSGADHTDPRLSPLFGDLTGLPPTVVTVAEYDPLADQGRAYAAALRAAGNEVELLDFDGLIHGYFGLSLLGGGSKEAVAATCAAFARLLAR